MAAFPHILGPDGQPRYLAALPPRPDFGGHPKLAPAAGLIPRSHWRDVDLTPLGVPVMDQGQHGSCVGHGSTSAFWFSYLMAGGTVPPSGFSPTSLYALINGGMDGGAVVSDAMDALIGAGLCTMAEVPESVIYARQIPASADATRARFRVADAYHCDSFDAIGSALQLGFPVAFAITINSGFNSPGAGGLVPAGGYALGAHCLCACGLARLPTGAWAIRVRNSWGARWGDGGDCLLTEWHFTHDGPLDAFAVRAAMSDPLDPDAPPAAP